MLLETIAADVRYALRGLSRSPGYAVAAILALALGIGANTAIFSAVDEILFRPPDLPEPGGLAQFYSFNRKTATYLSLSYPDYTDFRDQARSFQNLAAYVRLPLNVQAARANPERISVEAVSGNYFDMLGVAPLAGRAIGPADDAPGAAPVAMIAEDLWRTVLGAHRGTIGKPIMISGRQFMVVGIVPRRVGGLNLNWVSPPRIWIPLHATVLAIPRFTSVFDSRGAIWLVLTGRLNPGVSLASAQAEVQTIAARIAEKRELTAVLFPLSRSKFWPSYRKDIQNSLTGFSIAASLILLLACASVSNLLLGRALVRRRELAVRLAIGAGRGRLLSQLLTEGAVLAVLSCGAGVLVAAGLMRLMLRFPDALGLTLAVDPHIESRALIFCVALSALTILLFALVPSLQTARLAIVPSLKEGSNAATGGRQWIRGGLVALQSAFAVVLLVGGGLYLRTLWTAYATDLGFRSDHLLTAAFSLPAPGSQADRMWNAQRTLLQRLSRTPGVVSATLSSTGILSAVRPKAKIESASGPASALTTTVDFVGPEFFTTFGIPLLEGGDFAVRNEEAGLDAIVNRALARRLSPGRSIVGQTVSVELPGRTVTRAVVVGMVGDAKYGSVWEQSEPQLYFPARPGDVYSGFLHVRTMAPPGELAEPVRKIWSGLVPGAPLYNIETAGERVNAVLAPQRVAAGILGGFAVVALILTAVGLYSVVAFSVAQRRREIGIRLAIGALPSAIFATVLRKSMIPALAGLASGLLVSVPIMRIVATKATAVSPHDPATYIAVAIVLLTVTCGAAVVPARRAMRVDPVTALRSD